MQGVMKGFDGSLGNSIKATESLNQIPSFLQKYAMIGTSKIDWNTFKGTDESQAIQKYAQQLVNLNETQQKVIISNTNFDKNIARTARDLITATQNCERLNGAILDQTLSDTDGVQKSTISNLMRGTGAISQDGSYLLPDFDSFETNAEVYLNTMASADDIQQLLNAHVIEFVETFDDNFGKVEDGTTAASLGMYKLNQSFVENIKNTQKDSFEAAKFTNIAKSLGGTLLQVGKQLLVSVGITAFMMAIQAVITAIQNYKTHSEKLVEAMNESSDAAKQAATDVETVQGKIDSLNESVKAAGAEKISDIVDPDERERLQAINDTLETQLELKQQIQRNTNNKVNEDTSAVVNDLSEDSITKFHDTEYQMGNESVFVANGTPDKITKTESLLEHSDSLRELTQKRKDLQLELDKLEADGGKDTKAYKDKEKELKNVNSEFETEKTKVQDLSSSVSDLVDAYSSDSDNYSKYSTEIKQCTDAMTAGTEALADANDDVGISATNYDILLQKMKAAKNEIDNGNDDRNGYSYVKALDKLTSSGLKTGDDIRELSAVPANQTKEQAAAINVLQKAADNAHVSLDQFISALESVGLVATRDVGNIKSLSDAMTILDNMQSGYQTCAEAVKEYNKTGYVSLDTLQSLCQLEPQYLNMLDLKNGKLKINTETANTLTQANIKLAKAALLADTLNNIKDTNTLEKAKAILGDVTAVISDADTALTAASQKSANEAKDSGGWEAYDYVSRANSMQIKNYHTLAGLFDDLTKQDPSKIWGKADTGSKKATNQASSAIDAWSTLSSAMKEYNEQGYITIQTFKSLIGLKDKYNNMLVKNDATNQLEIQADAFNKLMMSELKAAQAKGDGASEARYSKILEWTNRNINKQTMSYWDLVVAIEGYSAALSKAKEITDGFKDAWSNGKTVKEKIEKSRAGALDYEGTESQSSALQDLMKYSEYDPELIGKAFNKETGKIDLSGDILKKAVTKSLKQQAAAARTEGGEAAEAIAASYEKSAENIENDVISVQDYFDGLGSTIEEVSSKIDELQSAWSDLGDVTNEYNTYGGLSVDSIQKLLTMSPEYLQFLKMDGDQLVFNRDAMLAYAKANLLTKAAELELKDETKDQAEILRSLANSLDKGADSMDGMGSSAEKLKSIFSDMKDLFSSLLDLIEDANSKKDNSLKIWGEAMSEDIDKRIDALNKQKEALEEANDEEERAITLAKLKAELEKARTQRTVRKYTGNGYEWVADESAVKEAKDNLNDQQREWRKEDAEKAIDDQIDALNDLKDKYSEAIGLIGESWDDYNKKLQYTAQIQGMTFKEMEGQLDGYKNSVVNSLKAASPVSNIKSTISSIENLINTLEKLNNVYTWFNTNGQSTDGGGLTGLIKNIRNLFGKKGQSGSGEITGSLEVTTDSAQKLFGKGGKLSSIFENGIKYITEKLPNLLGSSKSGTGIVGAFSNAWTAISNGAKGLFSNVAGSSGILSKIGAGFASVGTKIGAALGIGSSLGVPAMTAANSAGVTGVAGLVAAGGTTAAAAGTGTLATVASALPVVGAVLAALGIGVNHNIQGIKIQKDIWSNQEDSTAKKVAKSVGYTLLHFTPFGLIATGVKTISGFVKKIFGIQDKNNQSGTSSSGSRTETIYVDDEKVTRTVSEPTKKKSIWDSKFWFWNWGKKATGDKGVAHTGAYNVDEQGPELIVRKPQSGRYTYLETGDGVVPADITSRLFEMGGNPDRWFQDQMAKNMKITESVGTNHGTTPSISIGDIYVQKPIGDVDTLAREINLKLPTAVIQGQSKR